MFDGASCGRPFSNLHRQDSLCPSFCNRLTSAVALRLRWQRQVRHARPRSVPWRSPVRPHASSWTCPSSKRHGRLFVWFVRGNTLGPVADSKTAASLLVVATTESNKTQCTAPAKPGRKKLSCKAWGLQLTTPLRNLTRPTRGRPKASIPPRGCVQHAHRFPRGNGRPEV